MTFKYIELFAGIGGFRQALDRLGGTCVFASEIDKFAAQSYEALYGEKPAGDITKIDAKDIPDHDVLTAGFPCQAFSVAGQRKGFEDTRGTLFFEIARIASEKRPSVLLLENVKGLVNHSRGKTLEVMLETLGDIGYTVDFDVLNSKFFGVPQNRERIFIVAIRDDLVEQSDWTNTSGTLIVPKAKARLQDNPNIKTFNFDYPTNDTVTTRLRDVLETEVDEKYYLSDERTAALVAQLEGKTFEDSHECEIVGRADINGHDILKRVYSPNGVGTTLTTMGGGNTEPKIAEEQEWWGEWESEQDEWEAEFKIRAQEVHPVLTPDRVEKRQNGRGEESFTLTAQDRHGVALGAKPRYRIRKLTPRECWRLQGFSDVAHERVKRAGVSDSQRYKQSGNAITVPVVYELGKKLIEMGLFEWNTGSNQRIIGGVIFAYALRLKTQGIEGNQSQRRYLNLKECVQDMGNSKPH